MKNQTMRWDQPWNKVTTRTLVQENLLASQTHTKIYWDREAPTKQCGPWDEIPRCYLKSKPGSRKRWIYKNGNETRSLKMGLQKDGSSFEKVEVRLENLDLTQQKPSKFEIKI